MYHIQNMIPGGVLYWYRRGVQPIAEQGYSGGHPEHRPGESCEFTAFKNGYFTSPSTIPHGGRAYRQAQEAERVSVPLREARSGQQDALGSTPSARALSTLNLPKMMMFPFRAYALDPAPLSWCTPETPGNKPVWVNFVWTDPGLMCSRRYGLPPLRHCGRAR